MKELNKIDKIMYKEYIKDLEKEIHELNKELVKAQKDFRNNKPFNNDLDIREGD